MRLQFKIASVALCLTAGLCMNDAKASHIDELGVGVSLFSSDGTGGFVVKFEEYFGSNGSSWDGDSWHGLAVTGVDAAATATYSTPYTASLTSGPGVLSPGSGSVPLMFEGLVDSTGTPTAGFGTSQYMTLSVNGPSDASRWGGLLAFSIAGFDASATYAVDITGTDCCFVSGSTPPFPNSITIDPTIVVPPPGGGGPVPEPTSIALFGIGGLAMLVGCRRRRKDKAVRS